MTSIIHLEDNLLDHKLLTKRLEAEGLDFHIQRIETGAELTAVLQSQRFDLLLADYSLPQFDGLAALKLVAEIKPDVPCIIVSGATGELAAVEILKAGAVDYVLKDHLDRLCPAVKRALREAQDRAARHRAEQEVREARDIAEAANRAKDHFLAVLSHELRTPLTPALTAIQTMEADPALPPAFREAVQMIRRNVQLEVKLIDDLLDLTRVSRGKLELQLKPIEAHESIRQVLAICDAAIREKQLGVTFEPAASATTVLADSARFQQILWSLLKNAIKFTAEQGRIFIRTRNTPGGQFEVSVVDTGIGIEPNVLNKIFDAFEQGGKQVTKQFGGLGLGLAISRALAVQHGGTLSVFSEGNGRGATFFLRMPLTQAVELPSDTPPEGESKPVNVLHACRVLLVDDHLDTARAMGKLLKIWGCHVQTANSMKSALEVAADGPFDVLISDIGLPDGSGLELMQTLSRLHPVKGIAVSGFGMEEDLQSSRDAGFAEHLVKPVDLGKLELTIRKVMSSPAR